MARYWSDQDIDRITPPQVNDERGRAFLRTLDRLIGEQPLQDFFIRDAETCPASILPALIAEYSLEEFIEPGLPEHVVRQIIKNAWFLHEAKGYDDGVQLGLSLLGMEAEIIHWHQTEPKGHPNTHLITITAGEELFPTNKSPQLSRDLTAAKRIVGATKRFSQDAHIRFRWVANSHLHVATAVSVRITQEVDAAFPMITLNQFAGAAVAVRMTQEIQSHG